MIGLELLLKLNEMSFKELADKLGITKQNVSMWISGERKIPKKYVPILSEMFDVDDLYIIKEVTLIDGLKIQADRFEKQGKENFDTDLIYRSFDLRIESARIELKEEIENIATIKEVDERGYGEILDTVELLKNIIETVKSKSIPVSVLSSLVEELYDFPYETDYSMYSDKLRKEFEKSNKKLLDLLEERIIYYDKNLNIEKLL